MDYIRLKEMDFKRNIENRVFISFLAKDVSVRLQKDKTTRFITLNMVDKDKTEEAKIFAVTDDIIKKVVNGKTYDAVIDVKKYEKSPQGYSCILYGLEESKISPAYFADWVDNVDQCREIIQSKLSKIAHTNYGKIAYKILLDKWDKFSSWSAAKGMHHTQLGGLLSHTSEVLEVADRLADYFNSLYGDRFINKPLLLASALLHDVEKTEELAVDTISGNTEYSTDASLSSHIMNALTTIEITAYELGLGRPTNEKTADQLALEIEEIKLLKHCVASHHGCLEWGSPIVPNIPEAYILHKADEIDAEMYRFNKLFKDTSAGTATSIWIKDGFRSVYKENSKRQEIVCAETKIEI